MARNFVRASNQNIQTTFPALSGEITISGLFRHSSTPTSDGFPDRQVMLARSAGSANINYFVIMGSSFIGFQWTSSNNVYHGFSATHTADTNWHSLAIAHKWGQTTSTFIYLDGSNLTIPTIPTNATQSGAMTSQIGRWTTGEAFNGDIANVAVYDKALSAGELLALSKGFPPTKVGNNNLLFCAPLVRDLIELTSATVLTNSGATVANHPRVYA